MQGHLLIHFPDIYGYLLKGLQEDHDLAPAIQEPHCQCGLCPELLLSPKPRYRASVFPRMDVERIPTLPSGCERCRSRQG